MIKAIYDKIELGLFKSRKYTDIFFDYFVLNKIAVIVAGCVLTLAYAPFCLLSAIIISFPTLLFATEKSRKKASIFLNGFLFGFSHYLTSLYWMANPLDFFGDLFGKFKIISLVGIPLALAILTGILLVVYSYFSGSRIIKAITFSSLWVVFEMVRTYCILPFPWNIIGYTLSSNDAFLQMASITGLIGASYFVVLVGSSLYTANRNFISVIILLVIAVYVFGKYRLLDEKVDYTDVKIVMVQPNSQPYIATPDKRKYLLENFIRLTEEAFAKEAHAVIWPETAFPYQIELDNKDALDYLWERLPKEGVLIFGADRSKEVSLLNRYFFNSMFMLDLNVRQLQHYDKEILVPFGEYLPFHALMAMFDHFGLFRPLVVAHGFKHGMNASKVYEVGKVLPKFKPFICYEILFPYGVSFDEDADWLLNISNDGWFGNTTGPYQHLYMAKFRAAEYGVAVVRAATTGISAVIDPLGRIIEKVDYSRSGMIKVKLPKRIAISYNLRVLHVVFSVISLSLFLIMFIIERKITIKRR